MRVSPSSPFRHPALAATIAALLLAGCGAAPEQPAQTVPPPVAEVVPEIQDDLALPPSPYDAYFDAADLALSQGDWMGAEVALTDLASEPLLRDDAGRLALERARVAYLRGDQSQALALLSGIESRQVHRAIAYRARLQERDIRSQAGDYLASAQLGTALLPIAPPDEQAALRRAAWRDLLRVPPDSLALARTTASNPDWAGWLELAEVANLDPPQLGRALADWRTRHSGHPASRPLPGGLETLALHSPQEGPVALLLPLSGRLAPAGRAVLDGYLASQFQAGDSGREVLVLDSEAYASVADAVNDALSRGASQLVGPLSKERVAELALGPPLPLPVLALNRVEGQPPPQPGLIQFALAADDEARQLAAVAYGRGARRALLLRPAGSWGDEMETTLLANWQRLGGSVADRISYTGQDDYSPSIKNGLGISASETRRQRVRDMLATNVEFTPRRRQDVDVVFLLARSPEEARSLKPLLAFHYAGGLPVYTTSSAYGGTPDSRDRDLDDLRLLAMPWLLGDQPALHAELDRLGSTPYARLNALGIDAYLLTSRQPQLAAGEDALLRGATGLLDLNSAGQLRRELQPARFDGDTLRPL